MSLMGPRASGAARCGREGSSKSISLRATSRLDCAGRWQSDPHLISHVQQPQGDDGSLGHADCGQPGQTTAPAGERQSPTAPREGVSAPSQHLLCPGSPRFTEMSPLGTLQGPSGARCPVPSRQPWRGWGRRGRRGHSPAAPRGTRGCSQMARGCQAASESEQAPCPAFPS